jgi:hypothetical protein
LSEVVQPCCSTHCRLMALHVSGPSPCSCAQRQTALYKQTQQIK